ncbi:MAG: butyrate kinase [Chlorobi bacterium]|nr:butyrate kinase [Chlorobiota bacterium]
MENTEFESSSKLILAINPRVLYTQIAIYNGTRMVFLKKINHETNELKKYEHFGAQAKYRKGVIIDELTKNDIQVKDIVIIISRGGIIKPVESGIYEVNENIIQDLMNFEYGEDISDLGGLITDLIAKEIPNAKAYIADPVVVDEFDDLARVSGLKGIERKSIFHALHQINIARHHAKAINENYKELNLVIAHLSSGITIGAHHHGRVIDATQGYDGDGPFSPIRAGSLPVGDLVKMCFSGKYTKEEVLKMITAEGGLYSYLGTFSAYEVDERVMNGDEEARFYFDAMAYQVAKSIAGMFAVLKGEVNAIIITGPLAQSRYFVNQINERVSKLAPVHIYPGSDELESLALYGMHILKNEVEILEYK